MIIVKLSDGLGNQLFQYAAARHLAETHATVLKLDCAHFEHDRLQRTYELGPFDIQETFASRQEVRRQKGQTLLHSLLWRLGCRAPSYRLRCHIREQYFHFNPDILSLPDGIYLEGYWQSEKYFLAIQDIIRREFRLKTPQTWENAAIAEDILGSEAVNLHIRRGENVWNADSRRIHGTCTLEYYHRSVDYVAQWISNPHFFVFGDDLEWARTNLKFPYPMTFVDHNTARTCHEDLRLMSQCRHHIIANSSFSWWGAWLCQHPDKIVIAPQKWFNDAPHDTKDLIPAQWVRL